MQQPNSEVTCPSITVVIATRNRGDSVIRTVQSVLGNTYPCFGVLVIDQSNNAATEKALQPLLNDPRLVYVHSRTTGLGVSHNLAISQATTELIAITDDDCEVEPNWLWCLYQAFRQDERIGLVFGKVLPVGYNTTLGYIPEFVRDEAYLLTGLKSDLFRGLGIGACMALRRSAWQAVGGFDPLLGPGSPLGSLEDRDMAVRLLAAGYYVYYTPEFRVNHYGFRYNYQLRRMAYQDWFGFGSSYAKYLKCGYWESSRYMLDQMWLGQAVSRCLGHLRYRRFRNVTPVASFWFGFLNGLFTRVDPTSGHFVRSASRRFSSYYRLAWLLRSEDW